MHQIVLGYDLRLPWALFADTWQPERRELFLLDPAIEWPKSVDPTVWPSRFCFPGDRAFGIDHVPRVELEPEGVRQNVTDLWADPEVMTGRAAGSDNVMVRIDVFTARAPIDDPSWAILADDPLLAAGDWRLLGYDVADSSFFSALMNCGFQDHERAQMRRDWAPRLNRHGLLADARDADVYRAVSDSRVAEHAPFYVYALFEK